MKHAAYLKRHRAAGVWNRQELHPRIQIRNPVMLRYSLAASSRQFCGSQTGHRGGQTRRRGFLGVSLAWFTVLFAKLR